MASSLKKLTTLSLHYFYLLSFCAVGWFKIFKKVFNVIYFSMIITIWCMIAFAAGEDYASEVIYPDDLIPVEDLEGKLDHYPLKFLF